MCTPNDGLCLDLRQSLRALKRTFFLRYIWCSISNGNERVGEERIILASENKLIFKEVWWITAGSFWKWQEQHYIHWEQFHQLWSHFFCISIASFPTPAPPPQIWVNYLATSAYQSSSSPSIHSSWSSKYLNSLSLTFYWDLESINRGHQWLSPGAWLSWYFILFPLQWPSV